MLSKILIAVCIVFVAFLLLFLYSACVISGRCSREEEKREYIKNRRD